MKTNKILLGGIVGGAAFFLLGWLIYGILLMNWMKENMNQCAMKPMEEMIWWAMIASNLAWGFLIAIILGWSNNFSAAAGAKVGAVTGLLIMLSYDLSFYAMSTMYKDLSVVCIDVAVGTVFAAIGGAIIGGVMGMGKKAAA